MRRWLQRRREGRTVDLLFGITLDEVERVRDSDVKYIHNRYPLLEEVDRPWTRRDCEKYLTGAGIPIPPKSSCVFCPYRSAQHWHEIAQTKGPDWNKVTWVDDLIRDRYSYGTLYLIPARIPVADYVNRKQKEPEQLELPGLCEEGYCMI